MELSTEVELPAGRPADLPAGGDRDGPGCHQQQVIDTQVVQFPHRVGHPASHQVERLRGLDFDDGYQVLGGLGLDRDRGDPAPGAEKHLTIDYTIDGKAGTAKIGENGTILLPTP